MLKIQYKNFNDLFKHKTFFVIQSENMLFFSLFFFVLLIITAQKFANYK